MFEIFPCQNTYNKMVDSCIEHYTNSDVIFTPMGKIIQHVFENIIPSGYENFIRFYEILVSHTVWVLDPIFEKYQKLYAMSMLIVICAVKPSLTNSL